MSSLSDALNLLEKHVVLPLGKNNHYKQKQFLLLLAAISCLNWFAEGVSNSFRGVLPQADDLFHHLTKLSLEQVQAMFDELVKDNLKRAKRFGLLAKPVWLAVDFTNDMFYGEPNQFTRGCKPKNGSSYAYQYLVASIVHDNKRFVIAFLPFQPLDSQEEVLEQLLDKCKALVRIKCLLLDRGFYSSNVVRLLKRKRLKYVMPVKKTSKMKRVMQSMKSFPAFFEYSLNKEPVTLVFVKEGEETLGFCTNLPCWSSKLLEFYSWRWGIETTFRVSDLLQAKTCSTNIVVRTFLFYFALALYNVWILVNLLSVKLPRVTVLQLKMTIQRTLFALQAPPPLF